MWFWFALITVICWSGSDLLAKIGCQDENDKYSHLKMMTAIGFVMGLQAFYEIFVNGIPFTWDIVLTYLPVAVLYMGSMTMGYLGYRYIELSIASPICNSSGAVVAVMAFVAGSQVAGGIQITGVIFASLGVIGLGVVEAVEDEKKRAIRQSKGSRAYKKTYLALLFPLGYCLLDAFATFGDSVVLETIPETSVNAVYELMLFIFGACAFIYVKFIKRQKFTLKQELPKYGAACFETAGQYAYIFTLSDTAHVALAAPMITSYCLLSVVWGHIFLRERLSAKHYLMIAVAIVGIVLLGLE